jgi:hypothetical protein
VADAGAVAACVNAAYRHYVERIGKAPGPILEAYNQVITERQVLVADREGAILGVLVLTATEEGFLGFFAHKLEAWLELARQLAENLPKK